VRAKKACWWASPAAPRWQPSRKSCPNCRAGATVLGFNYDTGERYLSVEGFLPA
jgi:hypothetical protein